MKKKTSRASKSKQFAKASASKAQTVGERLVESVEHMMAVQRGEALPSRSWEIVPDGKGGFKRRQLSPERTDWEPISGATLAVRARQKLGLSQSEFAVLMGVPTSTLQGWEQGRRKPGGAARVLLVVAERQPHAVLEAAKAARAA